MGNENWELFLIIKNINPKYYLSVFLIKFNGILTF